MNRYLPVYEIAESGVPRACGDEPALAMGGPYLGPRSPRMRG